MRMLGRRSWQSLALAIAALAGGCKFSSPEMKNTGAGGTGGVGGGGVGGGGGAGGRVPPNIGGEDRYYPLFGPWWIWIESW